MSKQDRAAILQLSFGTRKVLLILTLTKPKTKIGPRDHGRKMSLREFEFIPTEDGYHYELSRGVITESNIANYYHALIVAIIRDALVIHKNAHPSVIHVVLTEMSSKLLIKHWESERHPDITVYLTKPKGKKNRKLWRTWIPEFVVEVVSPRSEHRDYVEKREEYWTLGVKEYWIVDAERELVVLLKRGKSNWIEKCLGPKDVCTTKLLPGFKLACHAIFEVAAEEDDEE